MTEFVFLYFSIEALVINFYKKMDCYQKLFHCYQSILDPETFILIPVSFNWSSLVILFYYYKVCTGF